MLYARRMERGSYVVAARTAFELASTAEVEAAWSTESACAGMSVGGLAHHLLGEVTHTVELLASPPPDEQPIGLLDHYSRAAWVNTGPDDEANVSIRESADAAASVGREEVLATAAAALERLPEALAMPRSPAVVKIPWQGWSLTTEDFLTTRAMEMVVHSDDLAASVGLETPQFPEDVVAAVLRLLSGVAVRRHGQTAVVRALSRPQRSAGDVSAF